MTIEDRNLAPGTVLAGRYRGTIHTCTVVESEGKTAYALDDGSIHSSPSAAASKLMGGKSVNGWRFFSLADDLPEGRKAKPEGKASAPRVAKTVTVIKKVPNQRGVPEGQVRYHCSACMESWFSEDTDPQVCPKGHARVSPDEFAE
jgi:hypothetical protein